MGPYEREDLLHAAMSVLTHEESDIFEDACLTVLLVCGPPPPTPILGNPFTVSSIAYEDRIRWLEETDKVLKERYELPDGRLGDFVTAFEIWCRLREEDAQCTT